MRYEVVNPSDECYLTSDDPEAAAAACYLLGEGWYALNDETGVTFMPILGLGQRMVDEWWLQQFGHNALDYLVPTNFPAIGAVLDTFEYAGERTSLNNIRATAQHLTRALAGEAVEDA